MLIINAVINTMVSDVVSNGYILIKDGKIEDIGTMEDLKYSEEDIIDLCGQNIYPGFIDAHTHLGMFEDGLAFEGDDGNEQTDPVTPQINAIDAVNPFDKCFKEAIGAGITTVATGPGSSNPIAGQIIVIKTYGKRVDKMVLRNPAAMKFALGENPKTTYNDKDEAPATRMATAALIREQLKKAQRYLANHGSEERDKGACNEDEFDFKCDALIPLLKGEIPAHFHAHRADDIFTAVRIAKEFNLEYVIVHGTESHLIADELKEEKAKILSGPILCDRSKPELANLSTITPVILRNNDIQMSIVTDHPVVPIQYLTTCVALAVREGLSFDDALKSITVNPAKILGIFDRVGSIEKGKDADLVVYSGNPFDIFEKPSLVMIDGRIVYRNDVD